MNLRGHKPNRIFDLLLIGGEFCDKTKVEVGNHQHRVQFGNTLPKNPVILEYLCMKMCVLLPFGNTTIILICSSRKIFNLLFETPPQVSGSDVYYVV